MNSTIQDVIIGMIENDAKHLCEINGLEFRVTRRDGTCLIPFDSNNHDSNRINVEIENGLVQHFLIH